MPGRSEGHVIAQPFGKLVRLMEYAPHTNVPEVPDPYYTGGFDTVYALVSEATAGLLAAIRQEHGV